jgi:hypothetical protein
MGDGGQGLFIHWLSRVLCQNWILQEKGTDMIRRSFMDLTKDWSRKNIRQYEDDPNLCVPHALYLFYGKSWKLLQPSGDLWPEES